MSREHDAASSNKPYPGFASYEAHDGDLFFGRAREKEELVTGILCDPLTLFQAPSGAGKTSLLNAAVLPALEGNNWLVVRVRIRKDPPLDKIRSATLDQILPAIEHEREALRLARDELDLDSDATLEDLLKRYRQLEVADPRRRDLIGRALAEDTPGGDPWAVPSPWICRVLRGSVPVRTFFDYLVGLAPDVTNRWLSTDGGGRDELSRETELQTLEQILTDPELIDAHRQLLDELDLPVPGLRPFFDHFFSTMGSRIPGLQLVLLFDQFEEIFTHFIDPRPLSDKEISRRQLDTDWRARPMLFNELASLYRVCLGGPGPAPLPIRFVFSLREEFVARLQRELRRFVPESEIFHYYLGMLEAHSAKQAITAPARLFGYRYDDPCYDLIIRDLTREGRYVEPNHLQVVCDKLWEVYGKTKVEEVMKSRNAPDDDSAEVVRPDLAGETEGDFLPSIESRDLQELGGVAGILQSVLRMFLDELATKNPSLPFEAIQMLQLLVTGDGTRNIVEQGALIQAPFRPISTRRWILDQMIAKGMLRIEARLGGEFAELTHEFLIRSIQENFERVVRNDEDAWNLSIALQTLEGYRYVKWRQGTENLLPKAMFALLHKEQSRQERTREYGTGIDRLDLSESWARELMFRCALGHGQRRATVKYWTKKYRQGATSPDSPTGVSLGLLNLSWDDLRHLQRLGDELSLDRNQIAQVVRSTLSQARVKDRDLIRYWIRRLEDHDLGPETALESGHDL